LPSRRFISSACATTTVDALEERAAQRFLVEIARIAHQDFGLCQDRGDERPGCGFVVEPAGEPEPLRHLAPGARVGADQRLVERHRFDVFLRFECERQADAAAIDAVAQPRLDLVFEILQCPRQPQGDVEEPVVHGAELGGDLVAASGDFRDAEPSHAAQQR
jgi:hypothetical protein